MVASENSASDENQWKKGMEVEVTSDEEGYTGIWFEATIVKPPPPPSSGSSRGKNSDEIKKSRIALVKYKTLAPSEAAKKRNTFLQEYIDRSLLRPVPPKDESNRNQNYVFEVNDVVDAYHLDGWWVGVVTQVLISSSGSCYKYRYIVDFENPPDKLELVSSDLRLHLDWVNGQWIKPPKKTQLLLRVDIIDSSKQITHLSKFTTPEQLGLSRNPVNSMEGIQLLSSDSGASKDKTKNNQIDETPINSYSIILRPSKRSKKGGTPESNGREKIEITPQQTGVVKTVDAIKEKERPPTGHVQHSPASVERTLTSAGGDNDKPIFRSKKSKRKQSNGENVHQMPSKDRGHTIQTKRRGIPPKILVECQKSIVTDTDARKCKSDGVQLPITTHDIDKQKEWESTSQTKRRGRIPNFAVEKKKCGVIDFDGNAGTFDGVQVPTSTHVNSSDSQDATIGNDASEKDHMENDSMAITNICYDQPLRILCAEGGILKKLNDAKDTNCTYIDVLPYNQELPFMKRSPLWEMIHSMKEFQMMKHFPHFNDLYNFEENCREGLAIGKLVIFINLKTERPNLKLDDPQLLWDSYLKVLLDLEMNGFDVQKLNTRFEEMLVIKDRQQRNQEELKKCKIRFLEEENKKRKIDEEMEELNEKFRKFEEKRAAMISIKEIQDSKTAMSQLSTNELLEDIRSTQHEFERVITGPLLT